MNEVNFLPETVTRQRAARKRRFGHVLIAAAMLGLLGAWWSAARARLESDRRAAAVFEQRVREEENKLDRVNLLREEHKQLVHQDRIQRELAQSISHSSLLDFIASSLPPSVAITDMTIVARRPPMRTARTDARSTGNSRGEGESLLIEFTGLAANDVEIANLVGALSNHAVFTQVKMLYSRSVTTRGVIGREFRIEMQVPLDRDYRPVATRSTEVAHAD